MPFLERPCVPHDDVVEQRAADLVAALVVAHVRPELDLELRGVVEHRVHQDRVARAERERDAILARRGDVREGLAGTVGELVLARPPVGLAGETAGLAVPGRRGDRLGQVGVLRDVDLVEPVEIAEAVDREVNRRTAGRAVGAALGGWAARSWTLRRRAALCARGVGRRAGRARDRGPEQTVLGPALGSPGPARRPPPLTCEPPAATLGDSLSSRRFTRDSVLSVTCHARKCGRTSAGRYEH